jgi:3'-5' exoribonuclease
MVITIELLHDKIGQIKDFPEQTAMMIKHLVLSHHGRYEFGSAVLPMIREAFVLHLIDDLDAKMNFLDRLSNKQEEDEYQWTDYQRTLERFLYVRGSSDTPENSAPAPGGESAAVTTGQSPARKAPKEEKSFDAPVIDASKQFSLWD